MGWNKQLRKTARVKNLDDAIRLKLDNPSWDIISTSMEYDGELIYDERRENGRSIKEVESADEEGKEHSSACSERASDWRKYRVPLDAMVGEKANSLTYRQIDAEVAKERLLVNLESGALNPAIELVKYCMHQEDIIKAKRKGLVK
jgi:hypothetical protein